MTTDWPWLDSLDALIAAPAQHRLVFENAHVRVLDTRIGPGERMPVHTHRWAASHYVGSPCAPAPNGGTRSRYRHRAISLRESVTLDLDARSNVQ